MTEFEGPETPEELGEMIEAALRMGVNDKVGMKNIQERWLKGEAPDEKTLDKIYRFALTHLS